MEDRLKNFKSKVKFKSIIYLWEVPVISETVLRCDKLNRLRFGGGGLGFNHSID
jgi:hypothetical protein